MDILQQFVLGSAFLIGFVNIVNMGLERDWKAFIKAMTAVILGGILGYMKFYNLPSVEIGLMLGVVSSGAYKGLQVLSGK